MPVQGESWSHEIVVEFRRRILRKLRKVLVVANIFLLLMSHCYQLINKGAADVFQGHDTIKWIYYAFEVSYAVSHLILATELSSHSAFRHAKMIFGTLGFEMLLWMGVSYDVWVFINTAILYIALLCSLGPECLRIEPTDSHSIDDGPTSEVAFDLSRNGLAGNDLDGNDLV